jgi:hypothetical protein
MRLAAMAGNQPVEPAACAGDDGDSGNGDHYRGDRVGREPLDVSSDPTVAGMAGAPVQDEQNCTGHDGDSQQFPTDR